MINFLFSQTYVAFASHSKSLFIIASFLSIIGTSLLVGLLLNVFSPEAAASRIPQVKTTYWKELGYMGVRPALIKFIAGILSIGGVTASDAKGRLCLSEMELRPTSRAPGELRGANVGLQP